MSNYFNMNILVTGSEGFIGKNLIAYINKYTNHKVFKFNKKNKISDLNNIISKIDYIFHFAGINRSNDNNLFHEINVGLTNDLCKLIYLNKKIKLIFASSKQANLNNAYGISKRRAENICKELGRTNGNKILILRLPGIFGMGCKPNYNSVVATFCFNIANEIDIKIIDEKKYIELIYINNLCSYFIELLNLEEFEQLKKLSGQKITILELANLIKKFKLLIDNENTFISKSLFENNLFETFKSYLPYK